jgi:hypothetical protein
MNAKVLLSAAVIDGQFGTYSSRWVSAIEEEQGLCTCVVEPQCDVLVVTPPPITRSIAILWIVQVGKSPGCVTPPVINGYG